MQYVDLSGVAALNFWSDWLLSFNCVLVTLKVFKYLRVSKKLSVLLITLGKAGGDLINCVIVLFIFVLGFNFAFFSAFK